MRPELYRNYLLGLLTVSLAFSYIDRIALGVVQESIKTSLALTDTQLGLMSGIAFTALYAVMGIPIARWSDRGNRVHILALTAALWSITVSLCAVAGSFMQLLLVRCGVGIGEAGCVPPAQSLIGEYFGRGERPRAVSIFLQGGAIAQIAGYFAVGWLNELYGWRATFVAIGLPGLILSVLTVTTLHESRPTSSGPAVIGGGASPGMWEAARALWSNATFRHLLICFSVWYFFGYGILQWQPTFFIRSHGMTTGEVGTWFALIYGLGSAFGLYLGGELVARYGFRKERLQLQVAAVSFVLFAAMTIGAQLATGRLVALGLLTIASIGGSMAQGPIFAALQTVVQPRMRATAIAVVYLFANLIGMGLGPLAVGALSDALHSIMGDESLRYALAIVSPGYLLAAWHLWRAARTVARDIVVDDRNDPGLMGDQGHPVST